MPNGTVKFFNAAKGFGFITPNDGGKDVFVPKASVGASGLPNLHQGQRVSFEVEPDAKGPKAIHLKLLASSPQQAAPVVQSPAPVVVKEARPLLTIYLDANSEKSSAVLASLRAGGHEVHVVDYMVTTPSREELKTLSLLLHGSGQSLVRKYDPLFQELRLDDRFISDGEYWGGVFEHPSLINGPVLVAGARAVVARSENSISELLGYLSGGDVPAPPKPKGIAAPVSSTVIEVVPASPPIEKIVAKKITEKPAKESSAAVKRSAALDPNAPAKPKAAPKTKTKAAPKQKAQATGPVKTNVKAAPATKTKKKSTDKPVNKSGRISRR